MTICPHTFGSMPAAASLINILQEIGNPKLHAKVSKLLQRFSIDLKILDIFVDLKTFEYHSLLARNAILDEIPGITMSVYLDFAEVSNVSTHLANVIKTKHRESVRKKKRQGDE